jgi:restriction endonuclease S subunit
MSRLLISCAPNLEVTVENFVLKENSERQIFYYNNCPRNKGKCGGGGVITLNGFEKSIRAFKYIANPIYFIVNGDVKARIILKKDGKTCADYVIKNFGKRYEEYVVRCEEK